MTKAIEVSNLGKMYKLFQKPRDKILNAFGLDILLNRQQKKYQEFWALQGINFSLEKGERVGIIGHNGAGKSTLLKIITGNVEPTEGAVKVNGNIQALMDLGTGFHPEFTGKENIRAALAYQGATQKEISILEQEIIEFAELEDFINQPLKTYSAGMYARLAFSVATAIQPDILIIDEILGVGDAYFINRCTERMKKLTQTGTTIILVSHSMTHILQFCERAIWIERGKIIQIGSSMEVVKAYERHNRVVENRRLIAKNIKNATSNYKSYELDNYSDFFLFRILLKKVIAKDSLSLAIRCMRILRNGDVLDELQIGSPQDADYRTHSSYIITSDAEAWSSPQQKSNITFRSLKVKNNNQEIYGSVIFHLYVYEPEINYEVEIEYFLEEGCQAELELYDGQQFNFISQLISTNQDWASLRIPIPIIDKKKVVSHHTTSSWPGTGELRVSNVFLLSKESKETAIYTVGDSLSIQIGFQSKFAGNYPIIFNIVIFRQDGVRVSCHISDQVTYQMAAGENKKVTLDLSSINLGNGNYVFSVALYRKLDTQGLQKSEFYDLVDRSYEFKIVGNEPIDDSIFHHPGTWQL